MGRSRTSGWRNGSKDVHPTAFVYAH